MTDHYNKLLEDEQERLVILAEELGEAQQAVCKILRHGYNSYNPDMSGAQSNRNNLEYEIGHVIYALDQLIEHEDVSDEFIQDHAQNKLNRKNNYLHHTIIKGK